MPAISEKLDLGEVKRDRLAQVAQAAVAGRLDAAHLRSLAAADVFDQLQQLPGSDHSAPN